MSTASCDVIKDKDYLISKYNQAFARQIFLTTLENDLHKIITLLQEINQKLSKKEKEHDHTGTGKPA